MKKTKEKNYKGRYSSINDFVERNSLQQESDKLFGKDWEPENDIKSIEMLVGDKYTVEELEIKTKRDERVDDYIVVKKIK